MVVRIVGGWCVQRDHQLVCSQMQGCGKQADGAAKLEQVADESQDLHSRAQRW